MLSFWLALSFGLGFWLGLQYPNPDPNPGMAVEEKFMLPLFGVESLPGVDMHRVPKRIFGGRPADLHMETGGILQIRGRQASQLTPVHQIIILAVVFPDTDTAVIQVMAATRENVLAKIPALKASCSRTWTIS